MVTRCQHPVVNNNISVGPFGRSDGFPRHWETSTQLARSSFIQKLAYLVR